MEKVGLAILHGPPAPRMLAQALRDTCPILAGMIDEFSDTANAGTSTGSDHDTSTDPDRSMAPTSPGRRAALYGVMVALALVAGYVEMLVPAPVAIPGVKLGLGNIVVLFALERMGARPAFFLMLAKVCCSAILFGNPQVLAFSLAGGVVSWSVMALAIRSGEFSCVATSVLGGISHNAGQLIMVALMLSTQVALVNAPVLAIAGAVCGLVIGIAVRAVLRAVPKETVHG